MTWFSCWCNRNPWCGRHQLVVTIHADGWMAGCHCGHTYRMPSAVYGREAERIAAMLHAAHTSAGCLEAERDP